MNKEYPLDIFSIDDIDRWSEDFYWPVSQEYVERLGEELFFDIRSFIQNIADEKLNALFRIQVKFFFQHFFDILHAVRVIETLKQGEYNILYNTKVPYAGRAFAIGTPLYKYIVENRAPILLESNKWDLNYRNRDVKDLIKTAFKFAKSELSWIKHDISNSGKGNLNIIVFSPNPALLAHLKHTGERVVFTTSEQWVLSYRDNPLPLTFRNLLKTTSAGMRDLIEKLALKSCIPFSNRLCSYIENFTYLNLEYTAKLFNHIINNKKLHRPVHLWAGGPGVFSTRLLSEAVRYRQGIVSYFPHSGGVSRFEKLSYILVLFATSDRYGVYNPNEIPLYKRMINRFPLIQRKDVDFFPIISDEYKRLWEKHINQPAGVKQIKEIMIVPSSYQGDSRPICHPPDMVRLDWERRLIHILLSLGYKVIYKKHPKGRLYDLDIKFFGNNVKYMYERFPKVMNMADAFIFDTAPSTAMYEAMCTQKPVIFIKYGVPKIYPEAQVLLAKRCRIVSAKFDERNRIIVDENELKTALQETSSDVNSEYLERYIFPSI